MMFEMGNSMMFEKRDLVFEIEVVRIDMEKMVPMEIRIDRDKMNPDVGEVEFVVYYLE